MAFCRKDLVPLQLLRSKRMDKWQVALKCIPPDSAGADRWMSRPRGGVTEPALWPPRVLLHTDAASPVVLWEGLPLPSSHSAKAKYNL